jgi:integrase
MRLQHLFDQFYRPLRLRGRSANTTRLYGCTIRAFGKWLGYDPTIDDLSDLTLARYLDHRAATRSPYTAEKERSQLCSLWRFAADRGILPTRPEVPPAPLPDRVPRAWTLDELGAIYRAAVASRGFIGPVPAGVWYAALVSVLWETAERIGAVLECRPGDFDGTHLHVRAEYRKGGKRDRVYRLSSRTCGLLTQARGTKRLLEWPRTHTLLWAKYADIVARAGLGRGRHLSFHALRRSAASHYAARGGDPVQLLDHSSPRITHRWYLDRRMTDRGPAPCDVLPDLNGPKPGDGASPAA